MDERFVYWTDAGKGGSLHRAPRSGVQSELLVAEVGHPEAIALDEGHVYWHDLGGIIARTKKSGGSGTVLTVGPRLSVAEELDAELAVGKTHLFWRSSHQLLRFRKPK